MRTVYWVVAGAARRFFLFTGLPVPRFARRVNGVLRGTLGRHKRGIPADELQGDLPEEVAALARALERLETIAYLDRISRRSN